MLHDGAATQAPVAGVIGLGALFGFAQYNPLLKFLGVLTNNLAQTSFFDRITLRTRLLGRLLSRLTSPATRCPSRAGGRARWSRGCWTSG